MKKTSYKNNCAVLFIYYSVRFILDSIMLPVIFIVTLAGRLIPKKYDIGLGPEPIISTVYNKKALELYGYSAQTFVDSVYYITGKFDVRYDKVFKGPLWIIMHYLIFIESVLKYKCLYIFFTGGPLHATFFLWKLEPFLLKIAGVKTVIMPYGGDIQDMTRSPSLLFKHCMSLDYPDQKLYRKKIEKRIDLWTSYASHVIGGCDWVDYIAHWDTLTLNYFSIDTELIKPSKVYHPDPAVPLKILHAPNHRNIKGSYFLINAINELKDEGEPVELIMIERASNEKILEAIATADIVADQFVIGWYAMFAIEAMALGKPVLCYLRKDLEELYIFSGLVKKDEIPLINCHYDDIKENIRYFIRNREQVQITGRKSRAYVEKFHSMEAIGKIFQKVNDNIGILSSGKH